jgi:hypothetical protein
MRNLSVILLVIAFAFIGFSIGVAVAVPYGRHIGFQVGSEWALMQADILAREAGVFMPVYMKDGDFRVVVKQPRGLYKRAWQAADQHDDARSAVETVKVQTEGAEVRGKSVNAQL